MSHLRPGLAGCQRAWGSNLGDPPASHLLVGTVLAADQKVQHLDACLHVISPRDYFIFS